MCKDFNIYGQHNTYGMFKYCMQWKQKTAHVCNFNNLFSANDKMQNKQKLLFSGLI